MTFNNPTKQSMDYLKVDNANTYPTLQALSLGKDGW